MPVKRNVTFKTSTVIAAAGVMLFVLTSCMKGSGGLAVGKTAPKIDGAGWVNGKPPTAKDLAGKVVVVDAWASS